MENENEKSHVWPQVLASFTVFVLAISTGVLAGWPSPALPKLYLNDMDFNVTHTEGSYVVTIYPLGYFIACPLCSVFLDRLGRKFSLLCLAIPQIATWLLTANATGVTMLYVARIIGGVSEACVYACGPVYICEIAEPRIRGILGLGFSTAFNFGVLLINAYASYLPIRYSAYISLCFPITFLVLFIWMPPSPYFLVMKNRNDDARKCLRHLRQMQNVEDELTRLRLDVHRQISEPGRLRDIFIIRSNLTALLIVCGTRTLQQFSGGVSFTFYNQIIFEAAGYTVFSQYSIAYTAIFVLVSISGLLLVDRYGRIPLLVISTSLTVLCLIIEAIFFTIKIYHDVSGFRWVCAAGLVGYAVVRGIGLMAIPHLYLGELFSASVKGKATGIASIHTGISAACATKLFHVLNEEYGMHAPFWVFSVCAAVGVIGIYLYVPETKGKTLEEIQQTLKGNIKN